jgi:predicted nucleic acid-binding protein
VVLDASVALRWALEDERSPAADSVLHTLAVSGATVPAIWAFEVGNGLLGALRRQRIDERGVTRFLDSIRVLPIVAEAPPSPIRVGELVTLAHQCAISVYDAAYLELASREDSPLATFDAPLATAAVQRGVAIFPGTGE